MKKAFSTVACMTDDYRQVITCALQTGQKGIEIRLDQNGRLFGLEQRELSDMAEEIRKKDLEIVNLGTGICVGGYDSELLGQAEECLMQADMVGAKGIRIFPGRWYDRRNRCYPASDFDGMVRWFKEVCKIAAKRRTEVWIETHNDFSHSQALKPLLDAVNMPNLKIIWDVMHTIECGETPKETLDCLGDLIAHVHIKDGKPMPTDKMDICNPVEYYYTKPGEGEIPINKIMKLLQQYGYEGYYSVEWEAIWRREIADAYRDVKTMLEAFALWMNPS